MELILICVLCITYYKGYGWKDGALPLNVSHFFIWLPDSVHGVETASVYFIHYMPNVNRKVGNSATRLLFLFSVTFFIDSFIDVQIGQYCYHTPPPRLSSFSLQYHKYGVNSCVFPLKSHKIYCNRKGESGQYCHSSHLLFSCPSSRNMEQLSTLESIINALTFGI